MPADAAPSFLWVEELTRAGAELMLPEDESHYLARVCRAREGDRVTLTDGRGGLATARVVAPGPPGIVELVTIERADAVSGAAWILCGAPEGLRADWLVEKLAELGAAVFQPVDAERATWDLKPARLDRWRRLATAALRQSRRRFRLMIREPVGLTEALAALPKEADRWLADPAGTPAAGVRPGEAPWIVGAIGPAEGFSDADRARLEGEGFRAIALSEGRLRTETAALAWTSWWAAGRTGSPDARGASGEAS